MLGVQPLFSCPSHMERRAVRCDPTAILSADLHEVGNNQVFSSLANVESPQFLTEP